MQRRTPLTRGRRLAIVLLGVFAAVFVAIIAVAIRGEGRVYWHFLYAIPCGDKLGHFGLLAVFSVLLNTALGARRAPGRLAPCLIGSIALAVLMTLEEWSQLFIATRTFDPFDWLSSLAGIAAGGFLARLLSRATPRRDGETAGP